jgi:F-type H+-transporting ATPase subunit epsilon
MAQTLRLQIDTPERPLLDREVTEVQVPALTGYLGVLPNHAPLLAELGIGTLSYACDGRRETLLVHEGFVEVQPGFVRILATAAERISDIDVTRAQAAQEKAEKGLAIDVSDVDRANAMKALKRAQARLAAAKG